jgi:hypothetical protein
MEGNERVAELTAAVSVLDRELRRSRVSAHAFAEEVRRHLRSRLNAEAALAKATAELRAAGRALHARDAHLQELEVTASEATAQAAAYRERLAALRSRNEQLERSASKGGPLMTGSPPKSGVCSGAASSRASPEARSVDCEARSIALRSQVAGLQRQLAECREGLAQAQSGSAHAHRVTMQRVREEAAASEARVEELVDALAEAREAASKRGSGSCGCGTRTSQEQSVEDDTVGELEEERRRHVELAGAAHAQSRLVGLLVDELERVREESEGWRAHAEAVDAAMSVLRVQAADCRDEDARLRAASADVATHQDQRPHELGQGAALREELRAENARLAACLLAERVRHAAALGRSSAAVAESGGPSSVISEKPARLR